MMYDYGYKTHLYMLHLFLSPIASCISAWFKGLHFATHGYGNYRAIPLLSTISGGGFSWFWGGYRTMLMDLFLHRACRPQAGVFGTM